MPKAKKTYQLINTAGGGQIKAWVNGVAFDDTSRQQLSQTAQLPIIFGWIAAMPDVHAGLGSTIGSVIPTQKAIIPAAVGVDIGCGMMALTTSLLRQDLPKDLQQLRNVIEKAIPHGRSHHGRQGDRGSWHNIPEPIKKIWQRELAAEFDAICAKHPKMRSGNSANHLGTLGTGNHFIEICTDEKDQIWLMLHSGSRGVGNRLGNYFISLAKLNAGQQKLPHKDLAYFVEGSVLFNDYWQAVTWSQKFARLNREIMMTNVIAALKRQTYLPLFTTSLEPINCHHNYVAREVHYNQTLYITRKGAVKAEKGQLGIIPGSMGAKSYITRGLGNAESFHSSSHGAGRIMSRSAAKNHFSVEEHEQATLGVACRKDKDVLDETPAAYKPIDQVMAAQADLVEIVHSLKQVVCVKG